MGKIFAVRAALFLSFICFHWARLEAADHFVGVDSTGYSPNYLQIALGDNVFWINEDETSSHTITSANNLWPRGYLINYQDSFGLTFNGLGTYNYYDEVDGFGGTIVVANGTPAPVNDGCGSAIAMSEGTVYTAMTASATSTGDPLPSCGTLGKGVWYTFTPAAQSLVTISTCNSDFDTVMAVYAGTCGSLTEVSGGCNDDNGPACTGTKASVAFSGSAGMTYWILAGGFGGASGNLKIVATTSGPASAWQEAQVSFDIGPSIARPNTNLIHVVDSTNDRLLTLDTASGNFISSLRLYSKLPGSAPMCFSLDGQVLYVPLYSSGKLQVISLASLTTTDLVPLSILPTSVAAGSDGALYATANGQITKIDPRTGQNIGAVPHSFYSPIIKANGSGTRLYIMELGLSGGSAMIDEYAVVASALPSYVTNHYTSKENDKDFVIAEDIGWLYSTSGGVYGIGAWDMNTRHYSFWPYGSAYGVAVAMVPNDSLVYGASGDYYNPRIRSFNRLTGTVSSTFDIATSGRGYGSVADRSLKVTPNGAIFYGRENRKIGLINASALRTNIPVTAEVIDAGTNKTVVAGEIFSLSAIAPAASGADIYSWSTTAGPGPVAFSASNSRATSVQIWGAGDYTLEIVRSNSVWLSRDRIYVTVTPRPIRLDQIGLSMDGRLQMRLLSAPGTFEIQASSNLLFWEIITNVMSATGDETIADPITKRPQRFYRARGN